MKYNVVAENPESTVVAEYLSPFRRETQYQTEAELEKAFIAQLQIQAYEYLPIVSEQDLIANLRLQLETLNRYRFSDKEWEQFFKTNTISMDAGLCNELMFLNGMGLGFDAQVASENYTEPGETKKGGKHKYIWHIIKTLLFFKEKRMTVISGNDKQETDCFINTIAIGRRFAGGFFLTPEAIANDGLLDVCMIKKLSLFQRFNILLKVPKGKHIFDSKVNYYQTPSINVEFPEKVPFHVDGELNFATRFDVSILPSALKIIYNPDGNHFFKR